MLKNKKNKGIVLIWVYVTIVALLVLGSALLARSVSEHRLAQKNIQATQAFNLAETGIDRALRAVKASFSSPQDDLDGDGAYDDPITKGVISQAFNLPTGFTNSTQVIGQYKYRIDDSTTDASITDSNVKRIRAMGYVSSAVSPAVTRWVEAYIRRVVPPGIPTNNALWTSGQLRLNGKAYAVNGNVSYETVYREKVYEGITGTKTVLPAGTPMFHLNFDYLKDIAIAQGHYCTSSSCTYPASFWYDVTTPNVTYIAYEGWKVTGNETLGGIYVIAADVEAEIGSADLGGTVNVLGCVYALGNVKIHGTVDLDGGVWAGEGGATIDGNVDLTYNATYVNAFKTLIESNPAVNINSWHEPGTSIDPATLQ